MVEKKGNNLTDIRNGIVFIFLCKQKGQEKIRLLNEYGRYNHELKKVDSY